MSQISLYLEIASDISSELHKQIPQDTEFECWAHECLRHIAYSNPCEINIKVVSAEESQHLNQSYRGKNKPTNVLSFESDLPDFVPNDFLGDLAICAEVVINEAEIQQKSCLHHWAHLCVHGILHLVGYDHIEQEDAIEMESLEKQILAKLGIDDPYRDG